MTKKSKFPPVSRLPPPGFDIKLLPPEFEIWPSNDCNLCCKYCYLVNNKVSPQVLSFKQIARGIDLFCSYISFDKDFTVPWRVVILGGEPFMDFPLLRKIVEYVRKKAGSRMEINIVTNGTFLDKRKVSWLLNRGVYLQVSLDGKKETNDKNRPFCDHPEKSLFDIVVPKIKRLPDRFLRKMCIEFTITGETISSFVEDIRTLAGLGFGDMSLDVEMLEKWSPEQLEALKKSLRAFKTFFASSIGKSEDPSMPYKLTGFNLKKILPRKLECVADEIVLAPDGCFYPCSIVASHQAARHMYRIGDLKTGVDFRRFRKILKEVARCLVKADVLSCVQCPVGRYFDCRLKRKNPLPELANAREVTRVFREETGGIIHVNRAFADMTMRKDGDFHYLDLKPSYISPKPIRRLRLEISGGAKSLDMKSARSGVDLLLYSPGKEKRLALRARDPSRVLRDIEHICLYSMVKAKQLDKAVRIYVESGRRTFAAKREQLEFFSEHGICAGTLLRLHPGRAFTRPAAKASTGFENLLLEPARGGWTQKSLEGLEESLKGVEKRISRQAMAGRQLFPENFDMALDGRSGRGCPFYDSLWMTTDGSYCLYGILKAGDAQSGIADPWASCFPEDCVECIKRIRGYYGLWGVGRAGRILDGMFRRLTLDMLADQNRKRSRGLLSRVKKSSGLFISSSP